MRVTKRIGQAEIILEADTVEEMKLLLSHGNPRKPSFKCIACGHEFDGDGQSGCPNARNHIDPGSSTMKPWIAREELKEIQELKTDSEFEQKLRAWVDENIFENNGENPLENYGTIDRLRELLDKYGVEAEDILVAYRKEIEAEGKEKT